MDFYRPPTTQGTLEALGCMYRCLRAWQFYPKGHPTRRSSLEQAYTAMTQLLDGNTLLLTCGRTGFSFPDGEVLKDESGPTAALSHALFIRRVQKITFFHDLFQEDLLELFRILCLSPDVIQSLGGIDNIMAERGIRSIWVNEFDLASIRSKRQDIEQRGIVPPGIDEAEGGDDAAPVVEQQSRDQDQIAPGQLLQALLGRLAACTDDDSYLILVRQAVACADLLDAHNNPPLLFPLIELLASHSGDATRSENMRDCSQFAMEQLLAPANLLQRVLDFTGQESGLSHQAILAVLKAGGAAAITSAIEIIGRTGSLKTRKILSTALGELGETAVPTLLSLISDSRWFIVRNICAILGVIASDEALSALTMCLHHQDLRVRKEAVRSLAQLSGSEAETAIIGILRGLDSALHPQAISSLGGMQSKRSLPELLKIAFARDLFLKTLSLKVEALAAIALIGDRQVTPHLIHLLEERHLLAAARGRELKIAVATCLGRLGDPRALPALAKLAADSSELGSACTNAIALIEKTEGRPHGTS